MTPGVLLARSVFMLCLSFRRTYLRRIFRLAITACTVQSADDGATITTHPVVAPLISCKIPFGKYWGEIVVRHLPVCTLFIGVLFVTGGCLDVTSGPHSAATDIHPAPSPVASSCPAPGTFVPFTRLLYPPSAASYMGCDVTTSARYVRAGAPKTSLNGLENTHVILYANGANEQISGHYVAVSKDYSDGISSLHRGTIIYLSGATVPNPDPSDFPIFVASSVSRNR
jgi:hypothetical protein